MGCVHFRMSLYSPFVEFLLGTGEKYGVGYPQPTLFIIQSVVFRLQWDVYTLE
jgi:hypothetical protein